jgi:phosphatidylglycerol lysyltransferase
MNEPLSFGWFAVVLCIVGCAIWLGLFANEHVDYTHALWWTFAPDAHAPRSLRAGVASLSLWLVFGLLHMKARWRARRKKLG